MVLVVVEMVVKVLVEVLVCEVLVGEMFASCCSVCYFKNLTRHQKQNSIENHRPTFVILIFINEIDFYSHEGVQPPNSGNRYK